MFKTRILLLLLIALFTFPVFSQEYGGYTFHFQEYVNEETGDSQDANEIYAVSLKDGMVTHIMFDKYGDIDVSQVYKVIDYETDILEDGTFYLWVEILSGISGSTYQYHYVINLDGNFDDSEYNFVGQDKYNNFIFGNVIKLTPYK